MDVVSAQKAYQLYITADKTQSGSISLEEASQEPIIQTAFDLQKAGANLDNDPNTLSYAEYVLALQQVTGITNEQDYWIEVLRKKNENPTWFSGKILDSLPLKLKDNKEFILQCIAINGYALACASDRLKDDPQVALAAIKNWAYLREASPRLKDDTDFVLQCIAINGNNLAYASDRLKDDPEVALAAIKNNASLREAGPRLKDDKAFVLQCIAIDDYALAYASDRLKDDPEVALAAIKNHGSLREASPRLKDDTDFVLQCIAINGSNLAYTSDRFKDDPEVVFAAIKNGASLREASLRLKDDTDFVLQCSSINEYILDGASDRLKDDKAFVLQCIAHSWYALAYASDRLKDDPEVALAAIKNHGSLREASPRLKDDKDFVLQCIAINAYNLDYASDRLKNDKDFILQCIAINEHNLAYASDRLKDDPEVALAAIKNGASLSEISPNLKNNSSFLNALFMVNPFIYYSLTSEQKTNLFPLPVSEFQARLSTLNIQKPARIHNLNVLEEIQAQRQATAASLKPLAVIIDALEDYEELGNGVKGAFAFELQHVGELIDHGYAVTYYQVGTDTELISAIKDAARFQKISMLIINGHGDAYCISLGTTYDQETAQLDTQDNLKLTEVADVLQANSTLILGSCGTGAGRTTKENMANMLHRVFPQTNVYAPTVSVGGETIYFDNSGKIEDVRFNNDSERTYKIPACTP
jgi:hypothetical protein